MMEAQKISFQAAWQSSVVFFVDERLEQEIENEVERLVDSAPTEETRISSAIDLAQWLAQKSDALDVALKDLELSEEKFKRIISLLRKLGRIPGEFDSEWQVNRIKANIRSDPQFAIVVAELLFDGKRSKELQQYVPRYYLGSLDYRNIQTISQTATRKRYLRLLIGKYARRKVYVVEERIKQTLIDIQTKYGLVSLADVPDLLSGILISRFRILMTPSPCANIG